MVISNLSSRSDIQRDFVESFFEARSDASFIIRKYYTKILTECPNILIRKFKIRENVNNIGESIGTAYENCKLIFTLVAPSGSKK